MYPPNNNGNPGYSGYNNYTAPGGYPYAPAGSYYPQGYYPFYNPYEYERRRKSRDLFLSSLFIGLAVIFMTITSSLLYIFTSSAAFFAHINTDTVYFEAVQYIFTVSVSMFTGFLFICPLRKKRVSDVVVLHRVRPILFIGCVLMCCLGMIIGNIVSGVFISFFPEIENPALFESAPVTTIEELIVELLYVAAIPALVEEFCFRGVVLGLLRPHGKMFSVVASAVIFSAIHGNFAQIPFVFIFALFLAGVVIKTDSLWPAITAHFLNNATSCVYSYFTAGLDEAQTDAASLALYGVWFALGVIGLIIVLCCKNKHKSNPGKTYCINTEVGCSYVSPEIYKRMTSVSSGGKFVRFYLCPTVVLSLIYYLYTAITLLKW